MASKKPNAAAHPSFRLGDRVCWASSGARKVGEIVAIVPASRMPRDVGYPKVGINALPRGHESYVVRGVVTGNNPGIKSGGKEATYWPVVTLLKPVDGMTAQEVEWCHRNVQAVRDLMAKSGG